jgi:hypothetical protein
MTREMREMQKVRWDKIYSEATGDKNPYGFWDYLLDEEKYLPLTETLEKFLAHERYNYPRLQ